MVILSIDTSCDETSISLLRDDHVLSHFVSSQIKFQKKWNGVVPMLAKRKHIERIEFVITQSIYYGSAYLTKVFKKKNRSKLKVLLKNLTENQANYEINNEEYGKKFQSNKKNFNINLSKKNNRSYRSKINSYELKFRELLKINNPGIDIIAVTKGPGLSVALEVGIKAAKKLAKRWDLPLIPINHMEGHIFSGLVKNRKGKLSSNIFNWDNNIKNILKDQKQIVNLKQKKSQIFPSLGLLVSGGHTELVLIKKFSTYEIIGETIDDAAGEAFDKFSVMLNLGYPGGPIVEYFANKIKINELYTARNNFPLPIPMKENKNLDFSYSGLKTAAMYLLRQKAGIKSHKISNLKLNPSLTKDISFNEKQISQFCASFQYSIVESIRIKLENAIKIYQPKYIFTGGGVVANNAIRKMIYLTAKNNNTKAILPDKRYLGDNASMIGLIGYYNFLIHKDIIFPQSKEFQLLDRDPRQRL